MKTDVLIVGGGVCGVRLAGLLQAHGTSYLLAESRSALGGRVRTQQHQAPVAYADLGPAWVWPHQPRVLSVLRERSVRTFEQYTNGQLVFQDEHGSVRRFDMATMGGSLRIEGGMIRLVEALAAELDPRHCWRDAHLQQLTRTEDGLRARFEDGRVLEARRAVLTLPPRVVAATLTFEPRLSDSLYEAMRAVPTWMAGHAKAVAIYDTPFWRDHGLNGDAVSHCGPLGEVHDASPHDETAGALFGFFSKPASWRRANRETVEDKVRAQLGALFGDVAKRPRALMLVDWADDARVATPADDVLLREHPRYGPLPQPTEPWAGVLQLSGTELAPSEGGYVEGALAAAEHAATIL